MTFNNYWLKSRSLIRTLIFLVTSSIGGLMDANSDIEVIHERVVAALIKSSVEDSHIALLLDTIKEDGSWGAIDYEDVSLTGFKHEDHYDNMVALARAYRNQESAFHGSEQVRDALVNALSFWVENDFKSDNWWHNQIGVPNALITVLLLMDDELPPQLMAGARSIVGRSHVNAWGARQSGDRIKIAGIQAKHLLLVGDKALFDEIIKIIEGEIKFSTGRGMQSDFSFHHRVDRVNNTLSYGLNYANVFAEWASYVAGTSYTFSQESIQQLIDYYLDGICKQMVFGKKPDMGVLNRGISRSGALSPHGTQTLERLVATSDYREAELREIIAIRKGEKEPTLSHATSYWQSEHFTFQRPTFFTSVRMHSRRNQNMEYPYNGEGFLNHHRGDGANHISVTGDEYDEIAPVFDYQKIPGATILQKESLPSDGEVRKRGFTDFVGAVTDGLYGAAAFDFISPHDPVRAKKAWFFFDQDYVCLGTGVDGYVELPVATTLNQCRLDGEVVAMLNGQQTTLDRGVHKLTEVKWVLHDEVAYLFPEPREVELSNQTERGSWYRINRQTKSSQEEVKMDVFKIWIDHGSSPQGESYCYMVVPAVGLSEIKGEAGFRGVEVLSNTEGLQAVRNDKLNLFQAIFYKSGALQVTETQALICDSQGIIMGRYDADGLNEVSVSDPSRMLKSIRFSTTSRLSGSGENWRADWDEVEGLSHVTIDLPQGPSAGKSVTLVF